ncbi:MAG TPA: HNH endonuclease domain-containing protein [Clostridiales bacterium]|nr:HNH endonuclease domain-containing protein [Clostridiales bacterium]
MFKLPQDYTVDVRILEQLLEYEYLTTSYKIFWFSGMFKEIVRGNRQISFRRVVCRMIATAWYPLLQYHLNFGVSDKLNEIVAMIYKKYGISSDVKEEELLLFLDNMEDKEIEQKIIEFYRYVPYRLISPFYSEVLAGLKDAEKNKVILDLSHSSPKALYQIIMPDKAILVNENWFEYIYRNQNIVAGWLNYKMIYYLQKKNPNVPAIPFKLSPPYQRDLNAAQKYWSEVMKHIGINDIYTNKPLTSDNFEQYGGISIDHFIPWSFVLHDELWNLVPTFRNINSSKSNKLPKVDLYIDRFCDIQYSAFNIIRKNKAFRNYLEDYLTINKKLDLNSLLYNNISKHEFSDSIKSNIIPLFQIAYNQGYDLWCNDVI